MHPEDEPRRLSKHGVPIQKTISLVAIRKIVAEQVAKSHLTVPSSTIMEEIDVEELVKLKGRLVEDLSRTTCKIRVTYTHLFIKALSQALQQHPIMNSTMAEAEIQLLSEINIGVAVSLPDGNLIVPVIHGADKKNILEIANACSDAARRAKNGKLTLEDVRGGTFTLTNIGMLPDCRWQIPILNSPQCAILAVGSIRQAPSVRNGELVIRWLLSVSLTFDHRIVNGFGAALFLKTFSRFLCDPSELELGI